MGPAENPGDGAQVRDLAGFLSRYGAGADVQDGNLVNNGGGALSVTAGTVTGGTALGNSGIYARNGSAGNYAGTSLTLSTAAVTGYTGIDARNYGFGAMSITASGLVTGTNGYGINAYNLNPLG